MDVHGGYSKQFWQALGGGGWPEGPDGPADLKIKANI